MDLTVDQLALGAVWYAVFLFSTTLHEAAHAFTALRLGDNTAYEGGQVTLNPWPHVQREVFGTVVVPIVSFLLSGWMIGWASAPYDAQWAQRHPRRSAIMSAAGPASNLLLLILAGVGIRAGMAGGWLGAPDTIAFTRITAALNTSSAWGGAAVFLSVLFTLNLVLFLFNLLPVPPLDGSGMVALVLPEDTARWYQQTLWSQPALALMGIVIAWKVFDWIFRPALLLALNVLYPEMAYGYG